MILATKIVLLIISGMFFLSAMGTKESDRSMMQIIGGVCTTVILLLALIFAK